MINRRFASFIVRLCGIAMLVASQLKNASTALAPPVLRVALALPFLRSGLTRWDGFGALSTGTVFLFEDQFRLHILGKLYPFPAPLLCAYAVAIAELVFPALLMLGLATRFAATGLLFMTAIIQLTYPDGWANFHLYWAAIGLAIIALGPGPLSFDQLISKVHFVGGTPQRWNRESSS
jgi:putative oxidoreductase